MHIKEFVAKFMRPSNTKHHYFLVWHMVESSESLKDQLVAILDDKKADSIKVVDLHKKSILADYMIVASAQSSRQLYSMAEHLSIALKAKGIIPIIDGTPPTDWVVVDAGDIIVHLFRPEARTFYNLEKMWSAEMPAAGHA